MLFPVTPPPPLPSEPAKAPYVVELDLAQTGEHRFQVDGVTFTVTVSAEKRDPVPVRYGGCDCDRSPDPDEGPDRASLLVLAAGIGAHALRRRAHA